MKKLISFLIVIILLFSVLTVNTYATTEYKAFKVLDNGKDGLKQWVVYFWEENEWNIIEDINNYCKDNDCKALDIEMYEELNTRNTVIHYYIIVEKN